MCERFKHDGTNTGETRARSGAVATAEAERCPTRETILAVVAGSQYNVVETANLPRLPVGDDTLTTGGRDRHGRSILLGTLLFATLGGIAGARYHRKVDRAGFGD